MNYTRLALILAMAPLSTTPAFAASVTMLQFGSFETKAEAEKRLSEVTGKYSAELGKLPTSIREVKLPPDNITVYRTQAGPVDSRATAQAICSKLSSTGSDCYIVQTAMVAAPAAPVVVAAAKPAETVIKTPSDNVAAIAPTPKNEDITTNMAKDLSPVPARDPLNNAALASVNTPLNDAAGSLEGKTGPSLTLNESTVPENTSAISNALDQAVADQPKEAAELNAATQISTTPPVAHRSFWSRINPFSSSEPTKPVAAPAPVVDTKVPEVTSENLPAELPEPAANPITPAPVVVAAAPSTVLSAPVIPPAPAMQLPPPPAPLKASDREMLAAGKASVAAPEVVASPIAPAVAPEAPISAPETHGVVNVEEAKRVPVTSATQVPVIAPPVAAVPSMKDLQPPVNLQPSSTEGQKTAWAQIGPFANGDAALAYWSHYRQDHPDFPVVRVRVTSPYQQQMKGSSQSWLRVGPVLNTAFVRSLCASIAPAEGSKEPSYRCGIVNDLGTGGGAQRTPGLLPASRYAR